MARQKSGRGKGAKGGDSVAPEADGAAASGKDAKIRLDKWLFYARFFKTRGLAAEVIGKNRLRVNGQKQPKPGHAIGEGDVLTFPMGNRIRVIRVLALTSRRGPASEAQGLYHDLDPPPETDAASSLE